MKISIVATLLLAVGFAVYAQEGIPRMYTADPVNAKPGDVITVTGDYLDNACVTQVFLTDRKTDTAVEVTEQTKTSLKFKVPATMGAGRWAVMVLSPTVGPNEKYIEEPVKILVR